MPLILHCNGKAITPLIGLGIANSYGEAEHAVFYYMNFLSRVLTKWAIISEDADTILKALGTSKLRKSINEASKKEHK